MSDYKPPRKTCSIEGCSRRHFGHGLCGMHYQRLQVHGDVNHERPRWHGGRRKGHPLHNKWCMVRARIGGYDPAWNDFDRFLTDVGERPDNCALVAADPREPIGPSNFAWRLIGKGHPKPNRKSMKCSVADCGRPSRAIGLCALHYDRWIKRGSLEARTPTGTDPAKMAAKIYRTRLRQYGLTAETYDALNETQGGKCDMCGGTNPNGKRLSIDHDHDTGVVRALLCACCNTGIGMFGESEDRLRKAIAYLRRHSKASVAA